MNVSATRQLGAPRIRDDQFGSFLVRALQRRAEHRVRLRRVGAGDEDDVARLLDFAHRARCRRGVDRALHRRDRRRMAQPRAVVHVIRAQRTAEHAHHQVVLFVGALGRREAGECVGPAGRLDSKQLLRRQLHRFVPGCFPEWRVPVRRCRDAIADVHVEALEQRQGAHGLPSGARRRAGLGAAAFALDGPPGPRATLRAGRPLPDPALALFDPSLPDQRPSQAITMLREIVAETALDAR